ncbi:hypothetical protein TrVE_jg11127 [Triparma verrucosa]|uniref:6-phosphogluconate dehydrogenase, decarboxylating n=2 Tax=Triparma TaxID=722752 RepID=A0A9W7C2G7_9STRA|nr:hypothetical protein TrVE_jg11127 [Triparma verrucosa]GMI01997.1 hypothetical protein TrST_g6116 [Triparma strigata]
MSAELSEIGLYGLAIMGQNFALNMAEKGFKVSVCNRSPAKVDATVARAKAENIATLVGHKEPKDFIASLSKPRKVVLLVMAGKPVDDTIKLLSEFMEEGDIIVDGGNEWYPNSIRRSKELEPKKILFVGMGISGGEEGARNGPSLMPGGPKSAYDALHPILERSAAQVEGSACVTYCGEIGSGNYVKMVHNGIEYGDMQLIAEAYQIMKAIVGLSNDVMSARFAEWNKGELKSYLIEITADILKKKDDMKGEGYVIDKIKDCTGMKGTGMWTVKEAAEQAVPAPTIAAALDARFLSGRKEEREVAATILKGPTEVPSVSHEQILEDLQAALYAAKICSYAQGLCLIKAASDAEGWNVDLSECCRIWRGGCIIRSGQLDHMRAAFSKDAGLKNLMIDADFAAGLNQRHCQWRRIVTLCIASGIPCPAFCASLNYFDSYRTANLPANLTQAQRDFFGGHTFERIDMEGSHHCQWSESHKDIGDVKERTAGNIGS